MGRDGRAVRRRRHAGRDRRSRPGGALHRLRGAASREPARPRRCHRVGRAGATRAPSANVARQQPSARALSRRCCMFRASGRPVLTPCPAGRGQGADGSGTSTKAYGRAGSYRPHGSSLRIMDTEADRAARFWAAWSLALLTGSPRAVAELQKVALGPAPEAGKAFDLALRALPLDDAKAWLRALNGKPCPLPSGRRRARSRRRPCCSAWLVGRMRDHTRMPCSRREPVDDTGVDITYPGPSMVKHPRASHQSQRGAGRNKRCAGS